MPPSYASLATSRPYRSLFLRGPRPYFATAHELIEANTPTVIPEGMVVVFVPLPLVETKSGPQTALQATAIHIVAIASDAHIADMEQLEPAVLRCRLSRW